jgi:uncharacterized protein (DUF2147 family)
MNINCKAAAAFWLSTIALSITGPKVMVPALAADPLGIWYTEGNTSQVKMTNCGDALCGTLVWLKEPNDPETGKPKTDKKNTDESKSKRPLLGVEIVLDLKPSGTPDQWKGQVYNPKDGNTYSGSFTMTGPDTAALKGCAMMVICQTQTWTRGK